MKKITIALILIANSISVAFAHLPTQINGKPVTSIAPILQNALPAVVNISVEKVMPVAPDPMNEHPYLNPQSPKIIGGVGTGIIINAKDGLIVTNAHVIKDQKVMIVTLKNGRRYHAKLIGEDDGFDIAVIKINANHLSEMKFDDSNELRVGDFVVAVGSPFGLTQTVTSGVISALDRSQPQIEGFQSFIQTDAPINPGNSGGALMDMHGHLIGMNTAIFSPDHGNIGIGFAIPSNMVASVAEQLIRYGKVEPGMLGVLAQDINPDLADALNISTTQGVLVTQVVPGSPAQIAGLQAQDIIEKINQTAINSAAQLRNLMGVVRPGTLIEIQYQRDHKHKMAKATVGDPQKVQASHAIPYLEGMRLANFSDLEPDGTTIKGALVASVSDTSQGALAGLLTGDVIISADGKPVETVNALVAIAKQAKKSLLLKVSRGAQNAIFYLVIERDQ